MEKTIANITHLSDIIVKSLNSFFSFFGNIIYFIFKIIRCSFSKPFYFTRTLEQITLLGFGSIPITAVIGLTMGFLMSLNFGYGLVRFGGVLYVPTIVSLSLTREMAPIFTSLLIAGRVGSGISAELGSMNVTMQVDAIRSLGLSPIRALVVPRFWATVISLPLLSSLACFLGILGGMIICKQEFNITYGFYINKVISSIALHDYLIGIFKSIIFGAIIAIIASYKGLQTTNGTRGVGKSTTWSVVTSSILILITDFFASKIFLLIWDH